MKPLSLRLKGFLGIQKGLGVDEVSLDLSGLSGLIAFDGPNGRGKTTVLDNLQPYRFLPSRDGALQNHCYLKDSMREFVFDFDGSRYVTMLKINANIGRGEGFIEKDGHPEVSGSLGEYDKYIINLFGTPELFLNSIFAAQKSKQSRSAKKAEWTQMTAGEFKGLLREFLRLHIYAQHGNTCKDAIRIFDSRLSALDRDIEKLTDKLADEGLIQNIRQAEDAIDKYKKSLDGGAEKINGLASMVETEQRAAHAHELARARKEQLEQSLTDIKKDIDALTDQHTDSAKALRDKRAGVQAQIDDLSGVLEKEQQIIAAVKRQEEIDTLLKGYAQAIESRRQRITATREKYSATEKEIDRLSRDLEKLDRDPAIASIDEEVAQVNRDRAAQAEADPMRDPAVIEQTMKVKHLQEMVDSMESTIDPECRSDVCGYPARARKAAEDLPGAKADLAFAVSTLEKTREEELSYMDKRLTELEKQKASIQTGIDERRGKLTDEVKTLDNSLFDLNRELERLEAEQEQAFTAEAALQKEAEQLKPLADRYTDLAIAKSQKDRLHATVKDIDHQLRSGEDEFNRLVKAKEMRLDQGQKDVSEIKLDPDAADRLAAAKRGLEQEQAAQQADKDTLAEWNNTLANLKQVKAVADAAAKQIEEKKAAITAIKAERGRWQYIKDAVGPNGLQAIEIDGAVPVITETSNRLLTATFGAGLTVDIRTLDAEGREVLDVWCLRDDGSENLIDNLSGGEQVWITKAMRLALTEINVEKSGKPWDCILADEEDGALSRDNAIRFVSLYRTLLAQADMSDCYYISHRPEAVALADHRLVFGDKEIVIE